MKKLSDINIPEVGLGLWKVTNEKNFETASDCANQAGNRTIIDYVGIIRDRD